MAIKYDFYQQYPGPLGPHLNCLSDYTKTRKEEDRLRGDSIHRHPDDKQSQTHLQSLSGSKA